MADSADHDRRERVDQQQVMLDGDSMEEAWEEAARQVNALRAAPEGA